MSTPDEIIDFQPVKVRVDGQSEGMLAFVGGALVAVLVKLDETHGDTCKDVGTPKRRSTA